MITRDSWSTGQIIVGILLSAFLFPFGLLYWVVANRKIHTTDGNFAVTPSAPLPQPISADIAATSIATPGWHANGTAHFAGCIHGSEG